MKIQKKMIINKYYVLLSIFILTSIVFHSVLAEESVCAQVQMEIRQQASLERQAFDAVMRINNGLENVSLSNVSINVNFTDDLGNVVLASSNPDDTNAQFYIRIDTMEAISDVGGNGEVLPNTTAEIHWLIIPAPGSGGSVPSGKAYNVGATLDYNLGSDEHSIEVIPDTIYVKPLPQISLDYFLTKDVVADDPFTVGVEPPQPFTLGVRVRNNGDATAKNFKIDSAQPKIVDNQQGLLINFYIISSSIDGQSSVPDLLLDFGDIPGQSAKVGRWQMQTNLSGQFTEFSASYSHADELGGQLTSILEGINSYFLVHDVEVNLPGRDSIDDFLALEGNALKLFESNSDDSSVNDMSSQASLTFNRQEGELAYYDLVLPESSGFIYTKITDPSSGSGHIQQITRSDNTSIPDLNSWMTSEGITQEEKQYYIHLFDYQTPGSYELVLNATPITTGNSGPSIDFIAQQEVFADESIQISINASDSDNTIPVFTLITAPEAGVFQDQGDGTAVFQWTPEFADIGIHELIVEASDGTLNARRTIQISVLVPEIVDTDADQMDDNWELTQFATLDRDGSGDYDNDGVSDREEYEQQSDPKEFFVTGLPQIESPKMGDTVDNFSPLLSVTNSDADLADRSAIHYQFEIYADASLGELLDSSDLIPEDITQTQWGSAIPLEDNHWYTWRVRSFNGINFSQWVMGYFFVNSANDTPSQPLVSTPREDSQVGTITPRFEVGQSHDSDGDELSYQFLFYEDEAASIPLLSSEIIYTDGQKFIQWQLGQDLIPLQEFYWQAVVTDSQGESSQTPLHYLSFDLINQVPSPPVIVEPFNNQQITQTSVTVNIMATGDPDNEPLEYELELDNSALFNSQDKLTHTLSDDLPSLTWQVGELNDNSDYYLRIRAYDGKTTSDWVYSSFTINTQNDLPDVPVIINPGQSTWLTTQTPVLQVAPAIDPDGDPISYLFEVYGDDALTSLVKSGETSQLNFTLTESLNIDQDYYWRVRAQDNQGGQSDWSETYHFIVNDNTVDIPKISILTPAEDTEASRYFTIRWDDQDPDSNASIDLYYSETPLFDDAVKIVGNLIENNDGEADSYRWDIRSLTPGEYYIMGAISNADITVVEIAPGKLIKPSPLLLQTDLASPQRQGKKIQLSASYDNENSYEYRFMVKGDSTFDEWVILQEWSDLNGYLWNTNKYPGNYSLRVDARITGEEEILGTFTLPYEITYRWDVLNLSRNTDKVIEDGQIVDFHALYIADTGNYEYQYVIKGKTVTEEYQVLRSWSDNPDFSWNSTGFVGSHTVSVWVREQGADTDQDPELVLKTKSLTFNVQKPELEFTRDTEKRIEHAQVVNLSANIISGATSYEYSFSIKGKTTDGQIVVLQDWSDNHQFSWDSTNYIGSHSITVSARTPGTTQVLKTAKLGFVVGTPKSELIRDTEKIIQHAQSVNLDALVTTGLGSYEYRYLVRGKTTDKLDVVIRDWSNSSALVWNSSNYIGSHTITIEMRPLGTQEAVSKDSLGFNVKKPKVELTRDTEKQIQHGQSVNLQATAILGYGSYEYRYLVSGKTIEGDPIVIREWSSDTNFTWNSANYIGYHVLRVQLRETGKTEILSESKLGFSVQKPKIDLLRDTEKVIPLGQVVTLDTQILSGMADYEYRFRMIGKTTNDTFIVLQDWTANAQYIWDSSAYQGWHRIEVSIRQVGTDTVLRTKTLSFSVKP